MSVVYGASPIDWVHFDLLLGLTSDLLPVVSNPAAAISPGSKMKELGKTPSRYNPARNVVGIPEWTQLHANGKEMKAWSVEPDYGICVQTRTVRALDVDVTDLAAARAIGEFIASRAGSLPRRQRGNSSKFLLAFTLPGDMPKRKMIVQGGVIEFLATGQQFVAVGTHPSGVRYEWANGLPDKFPALTAEDFETLWSALAQQFAIEAPSTSTAVLRKRGEHLDIDDPLAAFLEAQGRVLDVDRDGALQIECPWHDEHTTGDTGDGSTVYFPAGTNGYEQGHFKCLHGHCTGRGDEDFVHAIGYLAADFEVVTGVSVEKRPAYKRHDKTGEILVTMDNMVKAISRVSECGLYIAYDAFRDEIVFSEGREGEWQPFKDADYVRVRIALERAGFKPPGGEITRDAVLLVAEQNKFDSAQLWLGKLRWDGVPRVEQFMERYMGTDGTPYTRGCSRYLWTALAGRVMRPGVKADMAVVFVGGQGAGKSRGVAALVPDPTFFTEISFGEKEADLSRKMRGRLVAELGELRGLHTKELESIKAWMTKSHEDWTPKYREFNTVFPRRLVFIGTTNKEEFLADETGERRWLPLRVGGIDIPAIERDRLQLWAEGAVLFQRGGVDFKAAEALAVEVHAEHTMRDPWEPIVQEWLVEKCSLTGKSPANRKFLRVHEVLIGALRFDAKTIRRAEEMRIGVVLRALGYARKQMRVGSERVWVYMRTDTTCH